jgi:plasmid segregation protein ParM
VEKPNNFKGVLNINMGVISIDDGGNTTGVVTKKHHEIFPSVKGFCGDRNLTEATGKHDYIVEYKNEKYVMGTLAKYDCSLPIEMNTKSKQNVFFDLSILVAIHQFGYLSNYLVTSVPIKMYKEEEKLGRINRLKGSHTITVNGIRKTFSITDVTVSPETAVAFWIYQPEGKTRYIDLGSRTIGYATTINEHGENRFIDTESGTYFGKGLEALNEDYDPKGLADYICGRLISIWGRYDIVYLLGGGALDEELVKYIREYFPKAKVMDNPLMSNADAMYQLGCYKYEMA